MNLLIQKFKTYSKERSRERNLQRSDEILYAVSKSLKYKVIKDTVYITCHNTAIAKYPTSISFHDLREEINKFTQIAVEGFGD